jgi:glycosyltransferase involved in cell wall biosynthesis
VADAVTSAQPWDGLRVALVHDWLTGMRGGEKVLETLCRIFPAADIYTLFHARGSVSPLIEGHRIHTSLLQRLPRSTERYRSLLPLFPGAIEWFDFDDVDLVISTSHCAAKAVVKAGRARHLCYCHSPMRYAWDQFDAYFGPARVGRTRSAVLRHVMAWLARWDRSTAHRVDQFVANSRHVASRISRYYRRRAIVLHPPVDTAFFTPGGGERGRYFLVVSALVPYKRLDVAIEAARRLGVPLRVVGTGPERARLARMAGPTVEFLGGLSDDALREEYRGAIALVLPGEEDFGISPVESLACGTPVVALARGGATESVTDGFTGVLVPELTADAFADGMTRIQRLALDPTALRRAAETFGADRFEAGCRQLVSDLLTNGTRC